MRGAVFKRSNAAVRVVEAMMARCAVGLQLRLRQGHMLHYLANRLSLFLGRCRSSAHTSNPPTALL